MAEDQGLPMTSKWDPEKLQQEVAQLEELKTLPLVPKTVGYIKRCGPGLLQSAMTLGAGSAAASVAAGAAFGYKLLWVQPLAMFLGVCMLAALSNVVLTTQERPYKAFGRETSKILIFLWALGTIMSSVIWHFPQYSLSAGAVRDLYTMGTGTAMTLPDGGFTPAGIIVGLATGIAVLCINIFTVWSYGNSAQGVKLYERFLQSTIALVIISFGIVVVYNVGALNWTEIAKGYCGYYAKDVLFTDGVLNQSNLTMVLGMLGAAVGINMTFLYPYSQLAKGWGPAHKTLAKWDLGMTMFLPFTLVTSLIMLAMTVGGVYPYKDNIADLKPLAASQALVNVLGPTVRGIFDIIFDIFGRNVPDELVNVLGQTGQVIFDLGLFGMTCGAVSTHMVVCGFTICEMFNLEYTKWRFRLFALVPSIGMLGVLINLPFWLPVAASAVCFTMLPIAYLIFIIMNNKRSYIGDAVGHGFSRWAFNLLLVIALLVATVGSGIKIYGGVVKPIQKIVNPPAAAEKDAVKPATTDPAKSADQAKSTDQAVPEKAVPAEATAEKVSDSAVNQ